MSGTSKEPVDPKASSGEVTLASGPPVSREEHNESLELMRSMMTEFRQLQFEIASLKNQAPILTNLIPQAASPESLSRNAS